MDRTKQTKTILTTPFHTFIIFIVMKIISNLLQSWQNQAASANFALRTSISSHRCWSKSHRPDWPGVSLFARTAAIPGGYLFAQPSCLGCCCCCFFSLLNLLSRVISGLRAQQSSSPRQDEICYLPAHLTRRRSSGDYSHRARGRC